ncbi:MAG: hypothetical protein ABIG67_07605 [Pseudomonadota bacterium]
MNARPRNVTVGVIVSALLFGCYHLSAKPIQPDSLLLPENAKVLICEARSGLFTYEILPFPEEVDLKGLSVVGPPLKELKGYDLDKLIKEMIGEIPVHMVLVVNPVKKVERYYNPYDVFRGWRERTYVDGYKDGRPVYRTRSEPVFHTEYKNQCSRMTYRLFQYDKDARFMGKLHLMDPNPKECPETTDRDIHLNETHYLIDWLKSTVSTKLEDR